jgi:hypothetical protein
MPIKLGDTCKPVLTPAARAVIKFLDSDKSENLYEAQELRDLCKIGSPDTLCRVVRTADLSRYRELADDPRKFWWGNPKTISKLRKKREQCER